MTSPTRFLYECALKTPSVTCPNGKVALMHELIGGGRSGECRICAFPTDEGFLSKVVMKKTFTDMDLLRRPSSEVICEHCVWAMGWAPGISSSPGGLTTFRSNGIYAHSSGVEFPSRDRWREILASPPVSPYMACIAVSMKKWLHIHATVERQDRVHRFLFEQRPVTLSHVAFGRLLSVFEELYAHFTKDEIESGRYGAYRVSTHPDIQRFYELEEIVARERKTDTMLVCRHVAKRSEEECTDSSTVSGREERRSQSALF